MLPNTLQIPHTWVSLPKTSTEALCPGHEALLHQLCAFPPLPLLTRQLLFLGVLPGPLLSNIPCASTSGNTKLSENSCCSGFCRSLPTPHSTGGDVNQKYQQASIYRAEPLTSQSYWNHKSLYIPQPVLPLSQQCVHATMRFLPSSPIPSLTSEGSSITLHPRPQFSPKNTHSIKYS